MPHILALADGSDLLVQALALALALRLSPFWLWLWCISNVTWNSPTLGAFIPSSAATLDN